MLKKCCKCSCTPHNTPFEEQGIIFTQGDCLEVYFEVIDVEPECIQNLYFSCNGMDLVIDLPYAQSDKAYCLRVETSETLLWKPAITTYDITMQTTDDNSITLIHAAPFVILKKRNPIYSFEQCDGDTGGA